MTVLLKTVEKTRKTKGREVVLNFDPMHQTHNNENGYLWQVKGKSGTKQLKRVYSKAEKITIFLDNARYQRNFEVQEYAESLGITLYFMPPYSPNLCLIERLWKFFKRLSRISITNLGMISFCSFLNSFKIRRNGNMSFDLSLLLNSKLFKHFSICSQIF